MAALNERFLQYLKYMDTTMKADNNAGHQWTYCNKTSKKKKGFQEARNAGVYKINCVDGPQWALKACGVAGNALSWYGSNGSIAWLNSNAKKNAQKYFDIIPTGGKTVLKLYESNSLCDGDILLGYQGMSHTNVYYGGGKSFDSGHAYATGGGQGAKHKKWIGNLSCKGYKVNYILRIKDRAHYRVQCGAFSTQQKFWEQVEKLNAAGYKTMKVEQDGVWKVQVGYFSGKTNAEDYAAKLNKKGFPAFVTEASSTKAVEVNASDKPSSIPTPTPTPSPAPIPVPTPVKTIYRVQVGVFISTTKKDECVNNIKEKTGFDCFYEDIQGQHFVFCGSFQNKEKAIERESILKSKNINCFIKEVKV